MRKLLALSLLIGVSACGGGSGAGSPTAPAQTETRVIHVDGLLDFGDVRLGESTTRTLRVFNNGNAPMTVTSLTVPSASAFTASWTSGTIAPNGGAQDIIVRFTPTEARSYDGTFTIVANHTSGTNTKSISARGVRDPFSRSGTGATVFDMPAGITRVRITANYGGFCENFAVRVGGRLIVNEILGSCSVAIGRTYDGTHLVSGTVVEFLSSQGVQWTITEIQ